MSRSRKATATLAVLLAFGTASTALADANSQTVYGALAERRASMMSTGRTRSREAIQYRGECFVSRAKAPRRAERQVPS